MSKTVLEMGAVYLDRNEKTGELIEPAIPLGAGLLYATHDLHKAIITAYDKFGYRFVDFVLALADESADTFEAHVTRTPVYIKGEKR